jgi:osmoprotectant transport system permease protein
MVSIALGVSLLIALPLGTLIARRRRLSAAMLGLLGILYTIPSLALMIMLLPVFGLGARSVIVALIVYAQIILVRNVVAGLRGVDAAVLEAARGMGMNDLQRWWRVELPLALPVILAGVRVAAVAAIAIAAIGALFGAGGLGTLLFDGITQSRNDKIVAGAIALAAFALIVNWGLVVVERAVSPAGRSRWRDRWSWVSAPFRSGRSLQA